MRTIKFRVRKGNSNSWLYFTLEQLVGGSAETFLEYNLKDWGQYTGLKDKNGREIYEGDIVDGGVVYNFEKDGRAIVEIGQFSADSSGHEYGSILCYGVYNKIIKSKFEDSDHGEFSPESLQVIGNIYENPELLNS